MATETTALVGGLLMLSGILVGVAISHIEKPVTTCDCKKAVSFRDNMALIDSELGLEIKPSHN